MAGEAVCTVMNIHERCELLRYFRKFSLMSRVAGSVFGYCQYNTVMLQRAADGKQICP